MARLAIDRQKDLKDAVRGMLLGVALGDALGAPCEWSRGTTRVEHYTGTFHDGWVNDNCNRYGHRVKHGLGQVTDDAEMTASLLGVVERGYDKDAAVRAYHSFANSGTYSLGRNTRSLFLGYKGVALYDKRFSKRFDTHEKRENAQSNGFLMRASPLALIQDEDERRRAVETDVSITNPSSISIAAAQIYVAALHLVLRLQPQEAQLRLRALVEKECSCAREVGFKTALEDALMPEYNRQVAEKPKGWCLHALSISLRAGVTAASFRQGLDWAIRLGGDTDTNGCITAALLGAIFGEKEMLEDAITRENAACVLRCEAAIESGKRGHMKIRPRPAHLHPKRMLEIGEALVTKRQRRIAAD